MFTRVGPPLWLCCDAVCMWGRSEREQCLWLSSLPIFSHFSHFPQSSWGLLVLIPRWVGLCAFQDPVGLSNQLSCEAGSFSCCHLNPHRCFQSEALRPYFPELGPWVVRSHSPDVPPSLSAHECGTIRSTSCHLACPHSPAASLPRVLSTPPT